MPAPFSIEDLEADPGFRSLDLEGQTKARDAYFQTYIATDPGFVGLGAQGQADAYRTLVDRDPVLDDDTAGAVAQVKGDIALLGTANPELAAEARDRLKARYMGVGVSRDSLVANVLALGEDVVSELWDPGENHYRYLYGREGQKLDQLTLRALSATATDPNELKALTGWTSGLAVVASIAESFIPMAAVGQLGKAGFLTEKAMGKVASVAARMMPGPAQRFVASAGEQTVQALAMGALSTVQTLVIDGAQDGWAGQTLPKVAATFGQNLATDYAMWMGLSALGVAGRFVKALRGSPDARTAAKAFLDMPSEKIQAELAQTILKTGKVPDWGYSVLSKEYLDTLEEDLARVRSAAAAAGKHTKEAYGQIIAQSVGVETKVNTKGFVEGFESGTGQALGTWRTYDDLVFDVTHNVAPKKGDLRAPTTFTTLRSKDTFKVADVDEAELHRLYAKEVAYGGPREIAHAMGGITGLRAVEVEDLFGTAKGLAEKASPPERLVVDKARLKNFIETHYAEGEVPVPAEGFRTASEGVAYIGTLRDLGVLDKDADVTKALFSNMFGGGHNMNSPVGRAGAAATWGVAKRLFKGAQIETLDGGRVRLVRKVGEGAQAVKESLHECASEADLRAWLIDRAFETEALPFEDLAGGVASLTGARLVKESIEVTKEGGKKAQLAYWVLRANPTKDAPAGRLLAKADTLADLMAQRPEVKHALRYPASYAPKMYIVDPEAGAMTFEGAVAYGQTQDLLMLGDKFGTPFTGPAQAQRVRASTDLEGRPVWLDKATRSYTWTPYDGAVPRKATSLATMQNMIAREKNTLDGLRREANARSAEVLVTRDGRLGVIEEGGEVKTFRTRREFERYCAERPVMDGVKAPDVLPEVQWDKELADGLEAEYASRVKALHVDTPKKVQEKGFKGFVRRMTNPVHAMAIMAPTESTLAEYSRRTGRTELYDAFQDASNARRLLNTANRQLVPFADRIIRGNSVVERERMGTLLWVDKKNRAEAARTLYGKDLTAKDVERIDEAEAVLDTLLTTHGMDNFSTLMSQRTEILSKVESLKKSGGLQVEQSALDVLRGVYGAQVPRSLELFAEGVSKNDFLAYLAERDIGMTLLSTIDRVNKIKIYKPLQQRLSKAWVDAKHAVDSGELPKSALEFFSETLNESFGLKTSTGEGLAESMTAFSQRFVGILGKSKTLRNIGVPQELETDDLIGKLGEIFTVNSQAWRVWAIPRNLTQVSLLGAVIGNGHSWRAFQYVLDHPEYIDRLYARGALQESIMAMGNESTTPLRALTKMGLHPMELADALTRGSCIKAAEDLVEQTARRYAGKIVPHEKLIRELQADLLNAEDQATLVKAFKEGQLSGAADLLGQKWQKLTQFEYARGSTGSATRGVIGRLFGKLGVYPLHTIDLYRRILTTGDAGARAERAARLVATSTAMYLAAEAVGISYSGFLATDPFSFSGGPYWTVLNDALNSIGDQPENATARSRLKRNLPRMVIPTAMWWPYAEKAVAAADSGDVRGVLYALATAPAVREDSLFKEFRSGADGFGSFSGE